MMERLAMRRLHVGQVVGGQTLPGDVSYITELALQATDNINNILFLYLSVSALKIWVKPGHIYGSQFEGTRNLAVSDLRKTMR
jgi:hypothetical protein